MFVVSVFSGVKFIFYIVLDSRDDFIAVKEKSFVEFNFTVFISNFSDGVPYNVPIVAGVKPLPTFKGA